MTTTQTERTRGRFVLIGCGDAKTDDPAEARDLYTSSYFAVKRSCAEAAVQWARTADRRANTWAVLSAEHGILMPRQTVAPYDTTIEDLRGEPIEGEAIIGCRQGNRSKPALTAGRSVSTHRWPIGSGGHTLPISRSPPAGSWLFWPAATTSTRCVSAVSSTDDQLRFGLDERRTLPSRRKRQSASPSRSVTSTGCSTR